MKILFNLNVPTYQRTNVPTPNRAYYLPFLILLLMSCFTTSVVYGQQQWSGATNTSGAINRSGNVGIGIATPSAVLDVRAQEQSLVGGGFFIQPNLRLQSRFFNPAATHFWDITASNNLNFNYSTSANGTFNTLLSVSDNRLSIGAGNNQINIGNAASVLNNAGHYIAFGASVASGNAWNFTGSAASSTNGGAILHSDNKGNFFVFTKPAGGSNLFNVSSTNTRLFIGGDGKIALGQNFVIFPNGSVAISDDATLLANLSSSPTANLDYGLHVFKGIRTEKVKVDNPGNWADYVFADDYQLPTLETVANFIATHKHLPDVPSAAEVAQNGINLGEMDATLLRKIEELTLYVLEQQKQITALQQEIQSLKN